MTPLTTARCICIPDKRCTRKAATRSGDLFLCVEHFTQITMLLIDDRYSPQTRRLLAFSRWDTAAEGQRLLDDRDRLQATS